MEITLVWIAAIALGATGHLGWAVVLVVGWFVAAKSFGLFDDDELPPGAV